MNFELAIYTSVGINNTDVISALSLDLREYFLKKEYGQSIKSFVIGIVCIAPQFESFYKESKPKYTKGKRLLNPDGIPITVEDILEYKVKIDYENFKTADQNEAKKILAKDIMASLDVFKKIQSSIKGFDEINFKNDLTNYFKQQNLIF